MTLARYSTGNIDTFLRDIDRYSIGLDRFFNNLAVDRETNYPPYNLIKTDETNFTLELALAGFKKEEISVYTEKSQLVVEANREEVDGREYVHRGLASRAFTRTWTLSEDMVVQDVTFVNGILSVQLERIVPEKHQRRLLFGGDKKK